MLFSGPSFIVFLSGLTSLKCLMCSQIFSATWPAATSSSHQFYQVWLQLLHLVPSFVMEITDDSWPKFPVFMLQHFLFVLTLTPRTIDLTNPSVETIVFLLSGIRYLRWREVLTMENTIFNWIISSECTKITQTPFKHEKKTRRTHRLVAAPPWWWTPLGRLPRSARCCWPPPRGAAGRAPGWGPWWWTPAAGCGPIRGEYSVSANHSSPGDVGEHDAGDHVHHLQREHLVQAAVKTRLTSDMRRGINHAQSFRAPQFWHQYFFLNPRL